MRRLIAFIIMAVTLVAIAVINMPGIQSNMNQGIEFKGGFEILYQVLDENGEEFGANEKESAVNSAADVINNRVDIAGVKNPMISIEGDDMIRVTVASSSEKETEEIRELISSNAQITFRDSNDKLLATADELLERENGATLNYKDGKPVVQLAIKDPVLFSQITTEVFNSDDPRMILWLGFEEEYEQENEWGFTGDSYADIAENKEAAKKIVSDATLSQAFDSNTTSVIIEGSFEQEEAIRMANLIRAGSINFTLKELSVSSVGATYGSQAFTQSLVAGLIGLIAVSVLMISCYGLAGLTSCISLLIYVVVTLVGFNLLQGEYGPDTIAAMVIGIGMAVDANIISFERTKDEILKGRSLEKAFIEGNKKSFSSILDSNITTLIAALSLFMFGTRTVKGFATMLILSIFFTIVIMVGLSKYMLSLLCKSTLMQNHRNWFGVRKKDIPDVNKNESQRYFGLFAKTNFMKHAKKLVVGSFGIIVVCLLVGFVHLGTSGEYLNLGIQFSEGTKIYFKTIDPQFSTKEGVEEAFSPDSEIEELQINGKLDQIVIGNEYITIEQSDLPMYEPILEKYNATITNNRVPVYTVSINLKYKLSDNYIDSINNYFNAQKLEFYNEETGIELLKTNYSLNFVSPVVAAKTVENAIKSLLWASLFMIIYIAFRFKLSYSLAAIIALIHDSLFVFAIFTLFRIEIGIEFVSAILAIIGYSVNDTIVLFDRIRENINAAGKNITTQDRINIANSSLQQTLTRSLLTTISTVLTVIALIVFGSKSSLNFNIAMFVGLIAGTFSSIYIAPVLWIQFEKIKDKHHAKVLNKEKQHKKKMFELNEPEEYVFYGIND